MMNRASLAVAGAIVLLGVGSLQAQEVKAVKAQTAGQSGPSHGTPFLGIGVDNSDAGTIVTNVVPGYPGHASGVRRGDVIMSIDDHPIKTIPDMESACQTKRPGDPIRLRLLRNGEVIARSFTLAEAPAQGFNDLHERFKHAIKDRNADQLADCFMADADLVDPSGKTYHGRDAIRSYLAHQFSAEGKQFTLDPNPDMARFLTAQTLVVDGNWTSDDPSSSGNGRYTSVWADTEAGWRIGSQRFMCKCKSNDPAH